MGHVTELMPCVGEICFDRKQNAALYDHDQEEVHPWYHRVYLEESEIVAEWTTTERSVIYRFEFAGRDTGHVLLRTKGKSQITPSEDSVDGWEEFQGARQYFHIETNPYSRDFGFIRKDDPESSHPEAPLQETAYYFSFNGLEKPIELRIGISFISPEQAEKNLKKETGGKSFETIREESRLIWKKALGKIRITGGTERQKRIFYTSLYRTYERMVNIAEDGRYFSGYDGTLHDALSGAFYVDDWLWDTYRSLHPLRTILNPEQEAQMVDSYVKMYEQDGWMPGFPQFYGDFPAMIGFHSAAMVWDAWQKGIRDFDVEKAYEGLKKNAMLATMLPWRTGPMCSLDSFYHEKGWYPALEEDENETVSLVHPFEKRQAVALTLEHSYDDWCLAQLARALGRNEDHTFFMKRSQNYRNVFHPINGFMSPKKADGQWVARFNPQLSGGIGSRMYFAENNSWIWTFSVQHDINGLIGLIGGRHHFVERLDRLFNQPPEISKWQFMGQFPDASGLHGMFPAGNEPAFHVPYLYNYAGCPWKTQRRIRQILDIWFDDSPLGLPGDEDGGAMCAWYVFSAIGFYPVTPGTGMYALGSPLFDRAVIELPGGKAFSVVALNNSAKKKYIQSAYLNGKQITRPWITPKEIMKGGKLKLQMGDRPNFTWGTDFSWYRND
jgi:predicted alpha-1,2-mannosidase